MWLNLDHMVHMDPVHIRIFQKNKIMTAMEESIISRLDRLDNILKELEEIRGGYHSPKSSTASTASSDGPPSSSADFSPKSLEKHCRPIDDMILETEIKGTLIDRLIQVEDCVFRLSLQLGQQLEAEKKEDQYNVQTTSEKLSPKRSLKHFVKSCVKGKRKDESNTVSSYY